MVEKTIIWTYTAARQRRLVLEFWIDHNQSVTYSERLLQQISRRTRVLRSFPLIGIPSEFPDTRVLPMGQYSIFYRMHGEFILIMAFWDNRDDPAKLRELLM